MHDELWKPIDQGRWREVAHLVGRVATEEDVKAGRAVFYSPTDTKHVGNSVHDMAIPIPALLVEDHSTQKQLVPVVVIQAERAPHGIIVGYRPLKGGNGVCMLEELEIISEADARFRAV